MAKEPSAKPKPRIPRFRSREEEAEFWDTHDSTEFDWRPVRMKVAPDLRHVLGVELESDVLTRLIETSRARGMGLNAFTTQLIVDGLDRMGAPPPSRSSKKGKHNG